jgi:kynurenine formamidase
MNQILLSLLEERNMSDSTDSANQLGNWGRWGPEDQKGALNLITPELIKQAAGLVRTGAVYSLAMPLEADGPQWPPRHKTWRTTKYKNLSGKGTADDIVTMHSHSGSHIDALCHVWYDDHIYNGFAVDEHITSEGATRNAIENVPAIVGRGVLLDVAGWKGVEHLNLGEPISAADLEATAASQNVTLQPGDILLVRTGWMKLFERDRERFDSGEPGLDMSTPSWLRQHDIVAVGSDNHAVEVLESIPPDDIPFHRVAIRDLGIYLLENLNLEELARDKVYQFLFIVAPLSLTSGVGSPVNPLAIA